MLGTYTEPWLCCDTSTEAPGALETVVTLWKLMEPWLHCDTSTEARGALESVGMLGKLTEAWAPQ